MVADDPMRSDLTAVGSRKKLLILSMKKVEGSRPDYKIQSPRSPQTAPIDEGLTRQMS
jgi:hypothetical protein